jgi:hypothetical protein
MILGYSLIEASLSSLLGDFSNIEIHLKIRKNPQVVRTPAAGSDLHKRHALPFQFG